MLSGDADADKDDDNDNDDVNDNDDDNYVNDNDDDNDNAEKGNVCGRNGNQNFDLAKTELGSEKNGKIETANKLDYDAAQWGRTAKNWDVSTGQLTRPFAGTAHSFACFGLLASLAPYAVLTYSVARSLCSLPRSQ